MSEVSHVQWFPGHMAKTRRIMASNLKLVDAVVEITDARIPFSSRNPEMKRIVGSKPRLVLLNKADSADPEVTAMWLDYYAKQGITALATDCRSGKNVSKFYGKLKELLKDDIEKWNAKGMSGRPIRIMIVGIPNVGKSSFINRLAGSRLAKVEDRPGVTRGKQWVKLDEGFELLDMPGVLWPKFEDKLVGERLAFTGAVKDDIMDMEYLACRLLEFLKENYPELIEKRYGWTLKPLRGLVPVDKAGVRLCVHILHRSFHCKHCGVKYIYILYLFHCCGLYRKVNCFFHYLIKKLLTLFRCKLFAVVYPLYNCVLIKYHSRCKHISCKRTSASFIAAAHHVIIFSYLVVKLAERHINTPLAFQE